MTVEPRRTRSVGAAITLSTTHGSATARMGGHGQVDEHVRVRQFIEWGQK